MLYRRNRKILIGNKKPDTKGNKEINKRQVNKCTMTDIMFITLINYIRENGTSGILTLSGEGELKQRLSLADTKSRLLVDSGFINDDVNRSIYKKDNDNKLFKRFMAQNEYTYTNNIFHKTLKFIKDNDYGSYFNTYKIYNSNTRSFIILSDYYDIALIDNVKKQLFDYLKLFKDDWTKYIQMINNKETRINILKYTSELFKNYFMTLEENEYKQKFVSKHGINYDIIYPAYIISIFDYEQNNIDIDNYIADKVSKLNFDRIDYIEQRSQKGIYKNTYDRIINDYKSIDNIQDALDKELFELIQNEIYYEEIQAQLYKWYTLSVFDKHKKTCYINKKTEQKLINKANKEMRNYYILELKEQGLTQKEVAEMLNIGIATVKRQWNK